MKTYEISKDPHGQVTCLIHQSDKKVITPLVPQSIHGDHFDVIGNAGCELALCILVDFFNEIKFYQRFHYVGRKSKAWRWYMGFYSEIISEKRLVRPQEKLILTELEVQEWVDKQKVKDVEKVFEER